MPEDNSEGDKNGRRDRTVLGALIGAGALVLAAIITGVFALISNGRGNSHAPAASQTTSSLPVISSPSQNPTASVTASPAIAGPSGTFTIPHFGATGVRARKNLYASGMAQNIQPKYHLDLFLQFDGYDRYYSAGNPNNAVTLLGERWTGAIYIGEPKPITIWLVDLSPASVKLMNREISYQSAGYPSITKLGTILASVRFTAK